MRINIDRIPEEGLFIQAQEPVNGFPALKEMADGEGVRFLSPITLDLRARLISPFVAVEGLLEASVGLECSRCLAAFSSPLSVAFSATYTNEAPPPDADEEETELTPETAELFHFKGKEIDLRDAVQEQMILSFPIRPLCREDCKGLCPGCGADLNQEPCGCAEKKVDFRFLALKNLTLKP